MLPLFDEPVAVRAPRPVSTEAQRDDYWNGHHAGLHGHPALPPLRVVDPDYWMDGWRLGALCRPRPRAVAIDNSRKGQR